jgi:hypothetical protein
MFRIAFAEGVPLEQCLTECTADDNCAGISHEAGDYILDSAWLYPITS